MRNYLIVASIVVGFSSVLSAQNPNQKPAWEPAPGHTTLLMWPNGAPRVSMDAQTASPAEVNVTTAKDDLVAGRPVVRLGNVSVPTLTLYAPPGKTASGKAANTGAAVVVFPGGGYNILAIDLEGTEVCDWLNSAGVNCILVKYRVPGSGPFPKSAAALQDAQRAISLVRAHAAEWHIDPRRIGVLGFSAGGHLAASASTHFDQRVYDPVDAADQLSCRPDFAVLVYPAYLVSSGNELGPDLHITSKTPPTFLVQAEDDSTAPVENSIAYFLALKAARVPAEMHLYAQGGHGFGLRPTALPVTTWPATAQTWFHTIGILPAGMPPPAR